MSHLRNLFYKPSSDKQPPHAAPIAVAGKPTDSPTVGTVATLTEFPVEQAHVRPVDRLIFHTDPRNPAADRFRLLRMRLREHWASGKLKRLLITSPLAHDGKSTVTVNLATALSERGKRSVLVVEGDLHHSSLAAKLRLTAWPGLTDCLQDDSISPLSRIRRLEPLGWHLLPAGEPRRNPTELLQTRALNIILQKVSPCFDWVLIDSPPVVALTDAIALQHHTDATLLVVRAGQTPQAAVKQAMDMIGTKHIVGIVLNGVERRDQPYYQNDYNLGGARDHDA